MKALTLAEFGRLDVVDLPDPRPGDDEVVLRIVATGICGSDVHGYTGENGRRQPGQVMGHESVGVVAATGAAVAGVEVGQVATFNPVVLTPEDAEEFRGREQHCPRKYVIGVRPDVVAAFAQQVVVPARNVVPLPEGMSAMHGALVEPLAVALHAVRRCGEIEGRDVVVIGGGPIGQSIVVALRASGAARVVVSEPDPDRRALVAALGATVIDPRAAAVPEAVAQELGGPVPLAIDAVGIDASMADALGCVSDGGTICLVGMGAPTLSLDAYRVSTEERTVLGSFTYTAQDFVDAVALAARSPEQCEALISTEVTLDQADGTFAALAAGEGPAGKVLVRLHEPDVTA